MIYMYNHLFCRVYNAFGWNEYPRVFGEALLQWLRLNGVHAASALDLGCGTGVLCETLHDAGIDTLGVDLSQEMIAVGGDHTVVFPEHGVFLLHLPEQGQIVGFSAVFAAYRDRGRRDCPD